MADITLRSGGILYRIRKAPVQDDSPDGERWNFEYLQNPKMLPDDWAPRGHLRYRDGLFHWNGRTYATALEALTARIQSGP